jgi:hypothetical protein
MTVKTEDYGRWSRGHFLLHTHNSSTHTHTHAHAHTHTPPFSAWVSPLSSERREEGVLGVVVWSALSCRITRLEYRVVLVGADECARFILMFLSYLHFG